MPGGLEPGWLERRSRWQCAVAALAICVGGCEGSFTNDLATDAPANPDIAELQVDLLGLELRRAGGDTRTLEFRNPERVDLLDLVNGTPLRMFTNEQLPAGDYTGVRLLFDDNLEPVVVDDLGVEFPVVILDGAFAAVDFRVEDNERSDEAITLTLDLRTSLAFDDIDDEYTLTPTLRPVRTGAAAEINGNVDIACPIDTSLIQGGAVYLFEGENVEPDDLDGGAVEPFATTSIVVDDLVAGSFRYALRFIPAGNYTLAVTCRGDEDELGVSDDLEFGNVQNVTLDADETLPLDLD